MRDRPISACTFFALSSIVLLNMSRCSILSQASQRQVSVRRWHWMHSFEFVLKFAGIFLTPHEVQVWHAIQRNVQFPNFCPQRRHWLSPNSFRLRRSPHTEQAFLALHCIHAADAAGKCCDAFTTPHVLHLWHAVQRRSQFWDAFVRDAHLH